MRADDRDDARAPRPCARCCPRLFSRAQPTRRGRPPAEDGALAPPEGRYRPHRARVRGGGACARRTEAPKRRAVHHPPGRGGPDPRRPRHRPTTIAAALLHDTVEDTEYTLDLLRADFGDEIAMLVDGVTKLDKLKYGDSAQAETVRKMVVAMSKDIRVLIIKLADRLHNTRTWGFVAQESAARKAQETLEIYARWRTASASRRSSGSSKTSRSRCSTRSSTSRSRAWCATARPSARVRAAGDRRGQRGPAGRASIKGQVVGRPEAVLLDLPEDGRCAAATSTRSTTWSASACSSTSIRDCYAVLGSIHARVEPDPGPVQGLHRHAEVQPLPVAAHDGDRAARASRSRSRSAPTRCTSAPSSVSRRTGSTRSGSTATRASRRARPGRHRDGVARATSATGSRRPPTPASSSTTCASRSARRRSTSSRRRARSSACPRAPRPSTSPTRCTPRSANRTMGAKVNGRLVPLESAPQLGRRRSRSSPPRTRMPAPARTGSNFVKSRPRAQQDPRVVHEGAPRGGGRAGQGRDRPRDAQAEPAAAEADEPGRRSPRSPRHALRRRVEALYAAVGEGHVSTQSVHREGASDPCRPRPRSSEAAVRSPRWRGRGSAAQRLRGARCAARPTSW